MKNNQGIGLIASIIITVILIIIISVSVNVGMKLLKEKQLEDLITDMLLVQGKAKTYSEEVSVKTVNLSDEKEEDLAKIEETENTELVGTRLTECSEEIQNKAKTAGITEIEQYYCLNNEDLAQMQISINVEEGEYILVKYNFEDTEIVYTKGFEYEDKIYYRLTELNEIYNK